jgi:hypothetical protein
MTCMVPTSVVDPEPYVFGLPDPDPFVRGKDLDQDLAPDPSIIKQKLSKTLIPTVL